MFVPSRSLLNRTGMAFMLVLGLVAAHALAQQPDNVYPTYGVHNPPSDSPCTNPDCVYVRGPGEHCRGRDMGHGLRVGIRHRQSRHRRGLLRHVRRNGNAAVACTRLGV